MGRENNNLIIWGNKDSMNLNSMILTNIQSSTYFKQKLFELKTYHEVIDEIYYRVSFVPNKLMYKRKFEDFAFYIISI